MSEEYEEELGWIIERLPHTDGPFAHQPLGLSLDNGQIEWVPEHLRWLRFARYDDADQFRLVFFGDAPMLSVTGHVWEK